MTGRSDRPLAQRRQMNGHGGNAIKQVGPEVSLLDLLVQLAVGSAHHPHLDLLVLLGANAAELAILQKLQKLGLQHRIQFCDLVQKESAPVRHFDPAGLGIVGPGECASFVTEQFAFQQGSRNRRTIHLHKGTIRPRRIQMQQPGDNVFSGAAFAGDEYGKICASDSLQLLPDIAHGGCLAKDHRFWRKLLDGDRAFVVRARQ